MDLPGLPLVFNCKWDRKKRGPKVNFCLSYTGFCATVSKLWEFLHTKHLHENQRQLEPAHLQRPGASVWRDGEGVGWLQLDISVRRSPGGAWLKGNPFKEILSWAPDYRSEKPQQGSNWSSIIQPFASPHMPVGEVTVIMLPRVACLYCNLSKTCVRRCRIHRTSQPGKALFSHIDKLYPSTSCWSDDCGFFSFRKFLLEFKPGHRCHESKCPRKIRTM